MTKKKKNQIFLILWSSYHWELSKLCCAHFHQLIEITVVLETFWFKQEMEKLKNLNFLEFLLAQTKFEFLQK